MKYTVRRSIVDVLGYIWMPNVPAAMTLTLSDYDVGNAKDEEGKITRDSVHDWLNRNAGDFSVITDFSASLEDGDETVNIGWESVEAEQDFASLVLGDDY